MVEAVYGLLQRQRMQCLSRPNRPDQVKESRVFQVRNKVVSSNQSA